MRGAPAFPQHYVEPTESEMRGMTLRDYFAAKAMQGFQSNASDFESGESLARDAYLLADAMLKAREA